MRDFIMIDPGGVRGLVRYRNEYVLIAADSASVIQQRRQQSQLSIIRVSELTQAFLKEAQRIPLPNSAVSGIVSFVDGQVGLMRPHPNPVRPQQKFAIPPYRVSTSHAPAKTNVSFDFEKPRVINNGMPFYAPNDAVKVRIAGLEPRSWIRLQIGENKDRNLSAMTSENGVADFDLGRHFPRGSNEFTVTTAQQDSPIAIGRFIVGHGRLIRTPPQ